jgi:hypothetical protein
MARLAEIHCQQRAKEAQSSSSSSHYVLEMSGDQPPLSAMRSGPW